MAFHDSIMGLRFLETAMNFMRLMTKALEEDLRPKENREYGSMTNEMFEKELSNLEDSFRFKSMLDHNHDLKGHFDEDKKKQVLLIYHAFKSACSEQLLDNPLTIGGYVRRCIGESEMTSNIVTSARREWGPR